MSALQNEALEKCCFSLSGGKWRKQLDYDDGKGNTYTLFQVNGKVGWSVDIENEGQINTESAGRLRNDPIYKIIEAELKAVDDMAEKLKEDNKSQIDNEETHNCVKQPPEPKNTTETWSVPSNKQRSPEKINYDDGLVAETLPAPMGMSGIVRPAVSAQQALAAWKEFQELKKYIIEPSDIQMINGKNHVKKSGWRKFATFYNLTDKIVEETRQDLGNGAFSWKIKVVCRAPNGRETEGVAICVSTEKKFAHPEHDVYTTCHTRAKNRCISDMIAAGEVSAEEMEA